ncbi:hypothetical protein [Planctomicrobium piriforme]|uniref:Uncharacterized protein n=1 Tax=Planctomicrobium piriforme TaxID=1576369 RepID=A0A1I3RIR8_9PLAN|nr:hypothetical protein [Planctomicrobium piriforme]SFJ46514.1 hypothetical protein SAMN05421753_12124 [Planctomicrobium piriforme]
MDKLQPLIRHHFWILAGIAVPLILYGYYSANGQLKAATAVRQDALQKTLSGVSPGNEPNTDYVKKLELINGFLAGSVDDAIVDLWRNQQARMTWPPLVAEKIPAQFMAEFDQQVPFIYKGAYEDAFRKLQERVQPVRPVDPMVRQDRNATVLPNQKVILAASLPQAAFGQFGISSQEMWDAQIDIWLTELLLDAIVKLNQEKESVSEAYLRRLDILQLMGGTGAPTTSDANAGSGGGDMSGMAAAMNPGGGMNLGPNVSGSVAFPPEQEFGPAMEGGGQMSMDMSAAGPGGAAAPTPPKRYIGDTEAPPYLQRGFYMSVIIQQNKIADFLTELVNSDWPIQVRRFQVGVNPYRTAPAAEAMPGMSEGFMSPEMSMSGPGMGRFESSSPSMSGMPGMGGGYGSGMPVANRANQFATNLPKFATEALNHPDLVKLDLCGIITMYKQPTEALAAVEARRAAELEAKKAALPPPVVPVEPAPAVEAAPAQPAPDAALPATAAPVPMVEGMPAVPAPAPTDPSAVPATPPAGTPVPENGAAPPPSDPAAPAAPQTPPQ